MFKQNKEKIKEKIQEEGENKNIIINEQSPKKDINNTNDEINKENSDKEDLDMMDLFIEFEKFCEEEKYY